MIARRFSALVGAFVLPLGNASAHSFTGTWVADLDTQAGLGKDIYLVARGLYRCDSCVPKRKYPADGKLRAIAGDPDITAESVTITGPRTIVTRLVEHAMRRTTTMTVASDDRTARYVSIDRRVGVKQALRTVYLARRVGERPRDAHPVSGTWQGVAYQMVPELVRTTELRDDGTRFTYRVPIGTRYTALFDGPAVPVIAPGGRDMRASVRRAADGSIVETRSRDGRLLLRRTFTLSGHGSKLTIVSHYPANGSTFRITAHRRT